MNGFIWVCKCMHAGLRLPVDQRQNTTALPMHLVDVLTVGDGAQPFAETSGNNQLLVVQP